MLNVCSKVIRYLLICAYYCIRPLLGPAQCRFEPSCGNYAIEQLKTQPLLHALRSICKQLVQCY